MPRFDPSANGHRRAEGDSEPPRTGGAGVLMVAVVSSLTGLMMLVGSGLGTLLGYLLGIKSPGIAVPIFLGAALGGIGGVLLGVRVAGRFGGSSEAANSQRYGAIGGWLGLAAAVGVASLQVLPIVAIMLPGIGAWLGDRIALRRA